MSDRDDLSGQNTTTLILIRHAETEGNVQQVWHGAMDAPLTEKGLIQAAAVAEGMAKLVEQYPVDVFYVSPLPRAQSTAEVIADTIGVQPEVEDGLREFDLGDWEGRSFSDLRESEDLWTRWEADPTFAPPQGESPLSFNRRVLGEAQSLVERHTGDTILAVSHGGFIGAFLATKLGEGPADWRRWDPHNCSINVLQTDDGENWRGVLVNDTSHLPEEALTETPTY